MRFYFNTKMDHINDPSRSSHYLKLFACTIAISRKAACHNIVCYSERWQPRLGKVAFFRWLAREGLSLRSISESMVPK
jgi:hypothetical protein